MAALQVLLLGLAVALAQSTSGQAQCTAQVEAALEYFKRRWCRMIGARSRRLGLAAAAAAAAVAAAAAAAAEPRPSPACTQGR